MANADHLQQLREGPRAWNAWREGFPGIVPDLSGAELALGQRQLGPSNGGPINFCGANLERAMLRHATLTEANLEGANLRGADLTYARMNGVRLNGADLTGALLDQADLRGAAFAGAVLAGTNLATTSNLTQAQIEAAVGDRHTALPAGLTAPERWHVAPADDSPADDGLADDNPADDDFGDHREATEDAFALPFSVIPGSDDLFSVLDLQPSAKPAEIRAAYRVLAKRYHPDLNPGNHAAERRFKQINEAYRLLLAPPPPRVARPFYRTRAAVAALFLLMLSVPSMGLYWFVLAPSKPLQTAQAPRQAPSVAPSAKDDLITSSTRRDSLPAPKRFDDEPSAAAPSLASPETEQIVAVPSNASEQVAPAAGTAEDLPALAAPPVDSPQTVASAEQGEIMPGAPADAPAESPAEAAVPGATADAPSDNPVQVPAPETIAPAPAEAAAPEAIAPMPADSPAEVSVPAPEAIAPTPSDSQAQPSVPTPATIASTPTDKPAEMAALAPEVIAPAPAESPAQARAPAREVTAPMPADNSAQAAAPAPEATSPTPAADSPVQAAAAAPETRPAPPAAPAAKPALPAMAALQQDDFQSDGRPASKPGGLAESKVEHERRAWRAALRSRGKSKLEDYLRRYPNGTYAALARAKLSALEPAPSKSRKDVKQASTPPGAGADPAGRNADPVKKSAGEIVLAPPQPPLISVMPATPIPQTRQQSPRNRWPSSDEPFADRLPGAQ